MARDTREVFNMVLPLTSVWTTGVMSVVMCVEKDVRTLFCCRVCGRRDGRGSVVCRDGRGSVVCRATDVAALYVVAHGPAATSAEDVTSNSRASREGTVAMG